MNELHRQSISIADLSVGMFVVDLDIPWINSPFLTHCRRIKSFKDIDALKRSGVKDLVIDVDRGAPPKKQKEPDNPSATVLVAPLQEADEGTAHEVLAAPPKRVTVSEEMKVAKKVRSEVGRVVNQIFESLSSESPLQITEIAPLIDETLLSLERNSQALMSLAHLSRKSQKLADHAFSTFCLALNMAIRNQCENDDLQALGLAALFHEAGWVQLPLNLMGKRTRYTANEERLIKQHVTIGSKLLMGSGLPELAIRIISEHHERIDGSGYPSGIKGQEIHQLSQVLAIADSYDEYVHQLQDKPGVLPRNALQSLYREARAGSFDGSLVTLFVTVMGVYPVSSAVLLSSGERGVVIDSNTQEHSVTVRVFYSNDAKTVEPFDAVVILGDAVGAKKANMPGRGYAIDKILDPNSSRDDPFGLLVLSL